MRAVIKPRPFSGTIRVPASKSHTIRRLLTASLAEGVSKIEYPLDSLDARSCAGVCRALGAEIAEERRKDDACPNPPDAEGKKLVSWIVKGNGGRFPPQNAPLDVGNSGTTLYLALAAAALGSSPVTFTGDEQIRRRGAAPLLEALAGLGIKTESSKGGCVPITVRGPWRGGRVSLPCPTSQYLSALLLAAPIAPKGTVTEIDVPLLNEKPYIELTLGYLEAQGLYYEKAADLSYFKIPGGGAYRPVTGPVAADFSSAAFPACAAITGGGKISLAGLDPGDSQGDKAYFGFLANMGCAVDWRREGGEWIVTVSRRETLRGGKFDLNATPDLLPAMAVTAAFAEGETTLYNAANARIKETDRVSVMAEELGKMGVKLREQPDGLVILGRGGPLSGGELSGRSDHRVVMALAAAALGASGSVTIDSAESAAVTWPGFLELIGAEFIQCVS